MNLTVIEVGPRTVRGPDVAPLEWILMAVECIDDQLAVVDERLVEVRRLWQQVLDAVAGGPTETLVLVFPTWWSPARVDLVTECASGLAVEVVVLQRSSLLDADGAVTVVEFSGDLVVVSTPGTGAEVLARNAHDVVRCLGGATAVLCDVPADVAPPDAAFTAALHAAGITVVYSDRRRLLAALDDALPDTATRESAGAQPHSGRRALAVLAGAVLSLAAVGGGWAAQVLSGPPPPDSATELLVEGRVAVRVPAHWTVERITSGAGSARVRVSAPTADSTALHITQSTGTTQDGIADAPDVTESLRRAFESEQPGVFVDFDPAGDVGGRTAVTYRERRAGSDTDWAVVADGATRIAIGCQSPPAQRAAVEAACVQAVRSAQVIR